MKLLKLLLMAAIYGAGTFIGHHFGNTFDAGWFSALPCSVLATLIWTSDDE